MSVEKGHALFGTIDPVRPQPQLAQPKGPMTIDPVRPQPAAPPPTARPRRATRGLGQRLAELRLRKIV